MSLKTFIVQAEETALDALKSAGTILESTIVTDTQELVAKIKQMPIGTAALNIASALESHNLTGAEKFEMLLGATVPQLLKLAAGGGLPGLITSVESLAVEFASSVVNDLKVDLFKIANSHGVPNIARLVSPPSTNAS